MASENQVSLRLLVDEAKNKVIFAEAGKDFVDALLNFLTLPLGTIVRLLGKNSDDNQHKASIGSLNSLYESVANMEENQFWTVTCKQMLLQPRNSMELYCRSLKLNIDDTEETKYFACEYSSCSRFNSSYVSTFKDQRCKCGKHMNRVVNPPKDETKYEGFVQDTTTFIISDDLMVKPSNSQSVYLPMVLQYHDFNATKQVTLSVTQSQIVDLLKCSLLSKTPLTDTFLCSEAIPRSVRNNDIDYDIGELGGDDGSKMMKVKVMLRKSNKKVLFALAEEDFVDLLLSFLTFPLGAVENMLTGKSFLGSIDNLYKSVGNLDSQRYLRGNNLKDKLIKSRLAYQFQLQYSILRIHQDSPANSYYRYLEPRSSSGEEYGSWSGGGFVKKPSDYIVTDELVVTPSSPFSVVSFLKKSSVPPSDLEERIITIGKKEGLSLLKASLTSSSALTDGLGQFIKK